MSEKVLYLSAENKHHSKNTVRLQMFNFDSFPKWEKIVTGIAVVYGWFYHLFLLDLKFFTFEFVVKGAEGIGFAMLTAAFVRVTNIVIDLKIKPKIKKYRWSKKKTKTDDE